MSVHSRTIFGKVSHERTARTNRRRAAVPSHIRSTVQCRHAASSAQAFLPPSTAAQVSLHRADCFTVLPTIADASVDLILCDLPYGITKCVWDIKLSLRDLWRAYLRVLKINGAVVLTAGGSFAARLFCSAPNGIYRYEWIWDKGVSTGFANANRMPMVRHEKAMVFYRRLPTYNPQGLRPVDGKPHRCRHSSVYGEVRHRAGYRQRFTGYPHSILRIPRGSKLAACEKPVDLMEYFVRTYTHAGETVLDNCMGLGSTGVAAVRAGRKFIGIEIDRARFETARKRIDAESRGGK